MTEKEKQKIMTKNNKNNTKYVKNSVPDHVKSPAEPQKDQSNHSSKKNVDEKNKR